MINICTRYFEEALFPSRGGIFGGLSGSAGGGGGGRGGTRILHGRSRPSHSRSAGTEHVGFSSTRQALFLCRAKRREVCMWGAVGSSLVCVFDASASPLLSWGKSFFVFFCNWAEWAWDGKKAGDRTREPHSAAEGWIIFFFFFILRRMGKNKALAHHNSTYFHTRRVSILLSWIIISCLMQAVVVLERSVVRLRWPFSCEVWFLDGGCSFTRNRREKKK